MTLKVLGVTSQPAAARDLGRVMSRLIADGRVSVVPVAYGVSTGIFKSYGLDSKILADYGLTNVYVDSMSRLLETENPDLVILGTAMQNRANRDVIEQTMTVAAGKRGIERLAILDGWLNYTRRFSNIDVDTPNLTIKEKFCFLPDKIAIMDRYAHQDMIKEGFAEELMQETGRPHYDSLIELKQQLTPEALLKTREELGIEPSSYYIFWANQPIELDRREAELGYNERTALREVLDAVASSQNKEKATVLVKLHGREIKDDPDYSKKLKENLTKAYYCDKIKINIDSKYDMQRAMAAADLVISATSLSIIDALHLDRLAFSVQPGLKKDDELITDRLGITQHFYRPGELAPVMDGLLSDKNFGERLLAVQRELGKDFVRSDGKSTERVLELVYRMI